MLRDATKKAPRVTSQGASCLDTVYQRTRVACLTIQRLRLILSRRAAISNRLRSPTGSRSVKQTVGSPFGRPGPRFVLSFFMTIRWPFLITFADCLLERIQRGGAASVACANYYAFLPPFDAESVARVPVRASVVG